MITISSKNKSTMKQGRRTVLRMLMKGPEEKKNDNQTVITKEEMRRMTMQIRRGTRKRSMLKLIDLKLQTSHRNISK